MEQQVQFIGFTYQEAERFVRNIVSKCIDEHDLKQKSKEAEQPITPQQACAALNVSLPTLRRYVRIGLIRRKVFYLSELEEDIKRVEASVYANR